MVGFKRVLYQNCRYTESWTNFQVIKFYFSETGDQQNLEAEVRTHQGIQGLVADTGCPDPEVAIRVSLLVH